MATSLINNAIQVYFDSVFSMAYEGMVQMFKALESSGLRWFLGCSSSIYETALVDLFHNEVIGAIQGKSVEISEDHSSSSQNENLNSSSSSSSSNSRMLFTADDLHEISPTYDVFPDEETPVDQISMPTAIVSSHDYTKEFAQLRATVYQISIEHIMMEELTFFLCLKVKQLDDGIFISQAKYTKEILKKFGMENCSPTATPMSTPIKLDKDEAGTTVEVTMYQGMIGSLLYLTASRPDIMFLVCMCARFQADPKQSHYMAVKRILKYLKGTQNVGLWYPKDSSLNLIGYSDADYAGCKIDRRSTSGTCQFLGDRLISWFSKKQTSIATSTAEAEYLAVGSCCSQILWIQQQLRDYGVDAQAPIFCDNTSAIAITQNPVLHSRTKHIDIRHHLIQDHVLKKDVRVEHVSTDQQVANIFTKPLPDAKFSYFRNILGLLEMM
ncbi:hypothetical protein F511_33524 [Dorcoceras hygrometricum]|uniref:Reverse transcriptase Ty1/copia-type domain-containing protein n=1 Tax=Dorcoceras hygrometricum TaxID=472368 RepID=A0A2Z7BCV1_9LAMI|nr:hypothetical protein F511_33524 [Dorcoceras hygrometricum]